MKLISSLVERHLKNRLAVVEAELSRCQVEVEGLRADNRKLRRTIRTLIRSQRNVINTVQKNASKG